MSGGAFDYHDSTLKSDMFPYSWCDDTRSLRDDPFEDQEISQLMFDLLQLAHDLDWYKSGDTCEETYLKAKQKFRDKWFGKGRRKTLEALINRIFDNAKAECMTMIGGKQNDA